MSNAKPENNSCRDCRHWAIEDYQDEAGVCNYPLPASFRVTRRHMAGYETGCPCWSAEPTAAQELDDDDIESEPWSPTTPQGIAHREGMRRAVLFGMPSKPRAPMID